MTRYLFSFVAFRRIVIALFFAQLIALLLTSCQKDCGWCVLGIQNVSTETYMVSVGNGKAFTMKPDSVELYQIGSQDSVTVTAFTADGNLAFERAYHCSPDCQVVRVLIP